MNLFLDDDRTIPTHMEYLLSIKGRGFHDDYFYLDWCTVTNYKEFVAHIETHGLPDRISFDHDLGVDPETGYDCCKWLVDHCIDNGLPLTCECRFHTANPVGEVNMRGLIENFKKHQRKLGILK